MTQSIEYVVKVNATQAAAAVAEVEKRFGGIDNAAMRADKAIIALEKDMKDLNAAIAAGGPNVAAYKAQLEQLRTALYGAPGAAGGRGATSGMGAGMAALEASRALEDLQYGIGGVVNNIPGLVMALGMGAGMAGAISVVAVGINQVVKGMTAVDPATKEATAKAKEHVKNLRGEIDGLARDLRSLQVGAERAAMEAQAEFVKAAAQRAEAALAPIGGMDRFRRLEDNGKLVGGLARDMEKAREAVANLDAEMAKLAGMRRVQLEKDAQREIDLAIDRANAEEELLQRNRKEAQKEADKDSRVRYDLFVAGLDAEDKALREVAEARRKDAERRRKEEARELANAFKEQDRERLATERAEEAQRRRRLREEQAIQREIARGEKALADYRIDLAQSVTQGLTSSLVDYLDAKARGEKDAEARAVAGFLSTTGKQLIGAGVKGVFEGAILSANPLTPGAGAGMIATGGAAIVAGMAMAGGGAAITGSLSAATGAAGGRSPSGARRDPGASPGRTTGGTGGGGPLVVNVAYGVAGPAPEDTARAVARATRTGDRRSGR